MVLKSSEWLYEKAIMSWCSRVVKDCMKKLSCHGAQESWKIVWKSYHVMVLKSSERLYEKAIMSWCSRVVKDCMKKLSCHGAQESWKIVWKSYRVMVLKSPERLCEKVTVSWCSRVVKDCMKKLPVMHCNWKNKRRGGVVYTRYFPQLVFRTFCAWNMKIPNSGELESVLH
jgi:hypothetical protein